MRAFEEMREEIADVGVVCNMKVVKSFPHPNNNNMPSSSSLGDRKLVVTGRTTLQNNVSPPVIPNDVHKRRLRALNLFMAGIHTLSLIHI